MFLLVSIVFGMTVNLYSSRLGVWFHCNNAAHPVICASLHFTRMWIILVPLHKEGILGP